MWISHINIVEQAYAPIIRLGLNFLYKVEYKLEPVRFYGPKQYLIKTRTRFGKACNGKFRSDYYILMVMREGKLLFRGHFRFIN